MDDEVTKKDLQSLQGYVNNKLAALLKMVQEVKADVAELDRQRKDGRREQESQFKDVGKVIYRCNDLEDRISKLEKRK